MIIKSGLIGAALSLVTTVITNAVFAWLIAGERIPQSAIGYGTMVVLLVSSAVGAIGSIRHAQCKQLIASLLSGLLYFLCLLIITVFFFGGEFKGIAVTAAVIAAGSICVALILPGVGQKTHKGLRKKKHR